MVAASTDGQWVVLAGQAFPDDINLRVATARIRIEPVRNAAVEVRAVRFSGFATADAVVREADVILTELQTAAMWMRAIPAEVVVTDVFRLAADGSHEWTAWEREGVKPGYVPSILVEPWSTSRRESGFQRLVRAQDENPKLRDAMYYLYFHPDWPHLYKVLECAEAHVGARSKLSGKGWASAHAIRRFANTANNPNSIGRSARHAISGAIPPAEPMDLQEAWELMRGLLGHWIEDSTAGPLLVQR